MKTGTLSPIRRALTGTFALILLIVAAGSVQPQTPGFVTALLRSECTDAPSSPPPVGQTVVGPDYVIRTVGKGDPLDIPAAQRMATDEVFESLMTLYCALPRNSGIGCVSDRVQWNILTYDAAGQWSVSAGPASGGDYHYCSGTNGAAKGYITAVLKSECTPTPSTPPPVGQIVAGADYVILTVAEGDPTDFVAARQAVSDAVFESLMPRYGALPHNTALGCLTDRVQWNVVTYDAAGHSPRSVCAASGCDFHDSPFIPGYFAALLRSECTSAPSSPPPVGQTVVGPDYVIQTVGRGDPFDFPAAQQMMPDSLFESLMTQYCALPRNKDVGCVSARVQWEIITYDGVGNMRVSGGPTSGSDYHYCSGTHGAAPGYFTAVLKSECTPTPSTRRRWGRPSWGRTM